MAKSKNESNNKNSGTLLTEKDGTQYFVMGKVRIKVSEHFAQDGKPLDSLLEDVNMKYQYIIELYILCTIIHNQVYLFPTKE